MGLDIVTHSNVESKPVPKEYRSTKSKRKVHSMLLKQKKILWHRKTLKKKIKRVF